MFLRALWTKICTYILFTKMIRVEIISKSSYHYPRLVNALKHKCHIKCVTKYQNIFEEKAINNKIKP